MTATEIRELVAEASAGLEQVDQALSAACEQRARLRAAFTKLQRAGAALAQLETEKTDG